jgi:WD40 repeat protein/serine/threonine protein kinase
MQPKPTVALDPQERLDAIVTAYLKAVEAGQKPDRQQWLADHPDVAKELAEFFADEDRMARVAGPLRVPINQATPRPPAQRTLQIPAAIPVGRFGDYELQAEIARGGMGVVYKARQVSVNRIVALKMILGGAVASPADVQRFRNEAEAAAHLDHPNIIPIYDVGTTDGQPFFTMKLVTGGSLAERLPCAAADLKGLVVLLARVARAVHYAHQRGILHRDLKPANILITGSSDQSSSGEHRSASSVSHAEGPTPVVTDFGLAKLVERGSDITRSGAIVGTPTYMAPEQAKGHHKTITTAADVYSLGVILYEVLTGRVPFKGETPMDTVLQLIEREPTPPRQLNRRIDADLETICLKCLEKDPARRYESAEALADELDRWLAGESIRARPSTAWERARKWVWRKPHQALIAAMGLIIAFLCVIGAPVAATGWVKANDLLATEAQARQEADTARKQAQNQAEAEKRAAEAEKRAREAAEDARKQAEVARTEAQKQTEIARQALAEAQVRTYYARIGQIEGQLRSHNVLRARELLDESPAELRQWEWNYLNRLCHLELATCKPHNGAGMLWTAFMADGRVASLGWDNQVRVWEARTGRTLWAHAANATWGGCAALGPDDLLAFPTSDGKTPVVEVWDTKKNRKVATCRGHQVPVAGVAFSPDGKRLASTAHDPSMRQCELRIWDAATGEPQHSSAELAPWCVAFSPDSEQLAVGHSEGTLKVLDAASGAVKFSARKHASIIHGLAFRPGTHTLVTAGVDEIRLWDTRQGKETGAMTKQNGNIFTIGFSRDGKRLATPACDMTIRVWDAETQEELFALGGHNRPVMGVCFHPTENRLVSVSSDGTARLWNTPTTLEAIVQRDSAALRNAACSADGKRVATSSAYHAAGAAKVWEADSGKLLQTVKNVCSNAAISPDGRWLAVGPLAAGENLVRIFDATTGQEVKTLKGHKAPVTQVAFSPDGKRLASICSFAEAQKPAGQAEIKCWDVATGKELCTCQGLLVTTNGSALSFSGNGKRLATSGLDRSNPRQAANVAQVWDVETGALLFTGQKHPDMIDAGVALSPDGRYLAESFGMFEERAEIIVHDLTDRTAKHLKGHFSMIHGLAFAPDGKRLASASYDRSIKIWDPLKGEEVLTLHGHDSHVQSVAFSGDGRRLVSASSDKTFRIWDAPPPAAATAKK